MADSLYRKKGDKPDRIGFDPKMPEFLPLWAMAAGGNIVDETGAPTLDSPPVVDALTWAVGLINDQGGWASFKSFRDTWDFFGANNAQRARCPGVAVIRRPVSLPRRHARPATCPRRRTRWRR